MTAKELNTIIKNEWNFSKTSACNEISGLVQPTCFWMSEEEFFERAKNVAEDYHRYKMEEELKEYKESLVQQAQSLVKGRSDGSLFEGGYCEGVSDVIDIIDED